MTGVLLGAVAAMVLSAAALVGRIAEPQSVSGRTTPFGGPVPVHIVHVGRIEVDLEAPSASTLRRVGCAGPPNTGVTCYVAG